jgi:hypothetical protein
MAIFREFWAEGKLICKGDAPLFRLSAIFQLTLNRRKKVPPLFLEKNTGVSKLENITYP